MKWTAIDQILESVPLPETVPVRQNFKKPPIGDLSVVLDAALNTGGLASMIQPGSRVAIAVGSRGIANLALLVRLLVDRLRQLEAEPFVVPAMGSHGGATAAGQLELLARMGVTEQAIGVPIKSSMEVVELGEIKPGLIAYTDRNAAGASCTLILNRVKPHSSFRGRYESGMIKMLAIGLGNQKGAEICHVLGFEHVAERIAAIGEIVLSKGNVIAGLAVVENAYHQIHHIELVSAAFIQQREQELLKLSWQLYPKLPFDKLDVLVVGQIGKDISGTGLDCNVVGRYTTEFATGGPSISRIVALNATPTTGGNLNGIGIVDVTTQRVFENISFAEMYPNALTTTVTNSVKIPMVMADDRRAIQAAIRTSNVPNPNQVRLALIRDTLSLQCLQVSANMEEEVNAHPGAKVIGPPRPLSFNNKGCLTITGG